MPMKASGFTSSRHESNAFAAHAWVDHHRHHAGLEHGEHQRKEVEAGRTISTVRTPRHDADLRQAAAR
jgi:hypothetical protein